MRICNETEVGHLKTLAKNETKNCKSFSIILRKSESKLFYWILFSVKNLLIERAPTSKGRTTCDM